MMTSCENKEAEFPNFDYSTVYFAYQYPVRTIVLGEDIYDNTLDNQHKCAIYATMGGVYSNDKNIDIDVTVDNSLCDNLFFNATSPVVPMPSNYYTLAGNKISLNKSMQGSVEVQLTDAFFADSKSLERTYVIPLRMTNVVNADSILSGIPKVGGASRTNIAMWDVQPKDYVLYCVKFINPWDAIYLRRGVDVITKDGESSTNVRHKEFVEKDELIRLSTSSLTDILIPTDYKSKFGLDLGLKVKVNFAQDLKCSVLPIADYQINDSVRVYNISTNGNGEFIKKGEKNSWGNKDRDVLHIKYTIGYEVETTFPKTLPARPADIQVVTYNTTDTMVFRDRGIKLEVFTPEYKVN